MVFPFRAALAASILGAAFLYSAPAAAQKNDTRGFEPPISGPAIPSRQEAAEMGDQRQREALRGPFRNEQDRRRGRDETAPEGFDQPKFEDED